MSTVPMRMMSQGGVAFVELDRHQSRCLPVPQREVFESVQVTPLDLVQDFPTASFPGQRVEHLAIGDIREVQAVTGQFTVLPPQQIGQLDPAPRIVSGLLVADILEGLGRTLLQRRDPGTALHQVIGEGFLRDVELFRKRADGECCGGDEAE